MSSTKQKPSRKSSTANDRLESRKNIQRLLKTTQDLMSKYSARKSKLYTSNQTHNIDETDRINQLNNTTDSLLNTSRLSEHKVKFKEWPQQLQQLHDKQLSLNDITSKTNPLQHDLTTEREYATNQSENKASFLPRTSDLNQTPYRPQALPNAAGNPTPTKLASPTFFAWELAPSPKAASASGTPSVQGPVLGSTQSTAPETPLLSTSALISTSAAGQTTEPVYEPINHEPQHELTQNCSELQQDQHASSVDLEPFSGSIDTSAPTGVTHTNKRSPEHKHQSDNFESEYLHSFQWQKPEQHLIASKRPSTICIGIVDENTNPQNWQSEYEANYSPSKGPRKVLSERELESTSQLIGRIKDMNKLISSNFNQVAFNNIDKTIAEEGQIQNGGTSVNHSCSNLQQKSLVPVLPPPAGVKLPPAITAPYFYAWPERFMSNVRSSNKLLPIRLIPEHDQQRSTNNPTAEVNSNSKLNKIISGAASIPTDTALTSSGTVPTSTVAQASVDTETRSQYVWHNRRPTHIDKPATNAVNNDESPQDPSVQHTLPSTQHIDSEYTDTAHSRKDPSDEASMSRAPPTTNHTVSVQRVPRPDTRSVPTTPVPNTSAVSLAATGNFKLPINATAVVTPNKTYRRLRQPDSASAVRVPIPYGYASRLTGSSLVRKDKPVHPSSNKRPTGEAANGHTRKGPTAPHIVSAKLTDKYSVFDPILMNHRYPTESSQQIRRWTTTSREAFSKRVLLPRNIHSPTIGSNTK